MAQEDVAKGIFALRQSQRMLRDRLSNIKKRRVRSATATSEKGEQYTVKAWKPKPPNTDIYHEELTSD